MRLGGVNPRLLNLKKTKYIRRGLGLTFLRVKAQILQKTILVFVPEINKNSNSLHSQPSLKPLKVM